MISPTKRTLVSACMMALLATSATVPLLVPSQGFAQSRSDIREAKKRFGEGKVLYDEKDFLGAAEAFKDAYELSDRSELLYNIGQAYRFAGSLQEAETYFKQYLEERPDAPNQEEVVETIIEIQQEIAAQIATIQVTTQTPGREVFVDSEKKARCVTPCSVQVPPGKYALTVRGAGAQDDVRKVELEPSQKLTLEIALARSIVPGRLVLYTDRAGGQLRVGTDVTQALPLQRPISLEPGDYPVEVSDDDVSWRGTIRIEPEQTTQLLVPMRPLAEAKRRNSPLKAVAYSLWGVSAAITAGGFVMGLQTQDTYDLLTQQTARSAVDGGVIDQGRSQQLAANVMFGVGILTAATGIGLFLWDTLAADDSDSAFPIGPSGPVGDTAPRPTTDTEPEAPEPVEDETPDDGGGGGGIELIE